MDLKTEIIEKAKSLPLIRNNGSSNHWDMVSQDIRNRIIGGDIENFLKWHNIIETMFVNSNTVALYEYNKLKSSNFWDSYAPAIENLWPGNPIPSQLNDKTNNNAIHQLYHLHMFENEFGSILNSKRIVEFGGGYGCLCSIIRKLGFKGEYVIIDFPEFHLIQQYYLKSLGIHDFTQRTTPLVSDFKDATFFAFWSLSETELNFRRDFIINYFGGVKNFLLAYQSSYEYYDNMSFFNMFKNIIEFKMKEMHLDHIENNYYIAGTKNEN